MRRSEGGDPWRIGRPKGSASMPQPSQPTEPCPSWCVDTHAPDEHPDARGHWSAYWQVPFHLHRRHPTTSGGQATKAGVLLHQSAGVVTPILHLLLDDIQKSVSLDVPMTLEEAEQLGGTLLRVTRAAREGATEQPAAAAPTSRRASAARQSGSQATQPQARPAEDRRKGGGPKVGVPTPRAPTPPPKPAPRSSTSASDSGRKSNPPSAT